LLMILLYTFTFDYTFVMRQETIEWWIKSGKSNQKKTTKISKTYPMFESRSQNISLGRYAVKNAGQKAKIISLLKPRRCKKKRQCFLNFVVFSIDNQQISLIFLDKLS
jgi:hypothetical protein